MCVCVVTVGVYCVDSCWCSTWRCATVRPPLQGVSSLGAMPAPAEIEIITVSRRGGRGDGCCYRDDAYLRRARRYLCYLESLEELSRTSFELSVCFGCLTCSLNWALLPCCIISDTATIGRKFACFCPGISLLAWPLCCATFGCCWASTPHRGNPACLPACFACGCIGHTRDVEGISSNDKKPLVMERSPLWALVIDTEEDFD